MTYHKSVLLHEVLKYLDPQAGKRYIDATIGGAGHTQQLIAKGAKVLGIDRDPEAIEFVKNNFEFGENLTLRMGNFAKIGEIAKQEGFQSVDGILIDLGVSGHQLDTAERGFSFRKAGPLDMRMDKNITLKAYDVVNNFEKRRLNEIFETYGQEKHSWAIADAICRSRQVAPIETTTQLSNIIDRALTKRGVKKGRIDNSTKVFQSLRIIVNSELLNLQECLPQTASLIKKGGRLVTISFHSLEDGIVKRFLKQNPSFISLTETPIGPTLTEIESNPRARSAKLRVAEKN